MNEHRYSEDEIAAVYRVIRERRDMRHFAPGPHPAGLIERLIEAAHHAPSVGSPPPPARPDAHAALTFSFVSSQSHSSTSLRRPL